MTLNNNEGDSNTSRGAVVVNAQYIKDLSFENPRAPYSLIANEKPEINVDLDVKGGQVHENVFEVIIHISINASTAEGLAFVIELDYGGLFSLDDVDAATREVTLLVHCANIMFPYVRRVISDVTRDGGYPPLMLAPVDFMGLYLQRSDEITNKE